MSKTLEDLITDIDSEGGYLTGEWLNRLRAFPFTVHTAAHFLVWLPNIKPHLACAELDLEHGETDFGKPTAFLEFHTGGWSGTEDLIDAMLRHFWIAYFHTKWSRGGHFTFEVPESFLALAANGTAAPSEAPASIPVTSGPATSPRVTASINLVAFILFPATRKGSWRAWQSLPPDERRHFLDWATKELTALIKIGWLLTAEQYESPSGEDAE